jgi:hypothetical protein
MTIKSVTETVKTNFVGALVGGVALYYGAKKMKVENKYAHWGLVVVGAIAGAMAQSKLMSKATIKPAITAATPK